MLLKMLTTPVKIKGVEIHIWTFLLFGVSIAFGFFDVLLVAYAITAIHEMAHIMAAKMCGVKSAGVEILPFGITMRLDKKGITEAFDEIKIAAAGPFANFLIAYFAYGFYGGVYREYIITSSLVMGVFNLLPALPMDGGRIMRALMVKRLGHIRASSVAITITNFMGVVIFGVGLYALYATGFNFSFLLVGGFLIANMTEERKNADMIIMKDILYSRKKLAENGVAEAEVLVADGDEKAQKILKKLSYDRYYIVKILDNRMNVTASVTETQIIEAMAVYGMNITMKKIVGIWL